MEPEIFMGKAILVLGMHRSGTSALSGAMVQLGAVAPRTLMPATRDNMRGYWESARIADFNDELLACAGSTWDDWRAIDARWYSSSVAGDFRARAKPLLEAEFGTTDLIVFKDPRVCRIIPFWSATLQEMDIVPRIVIPFRSPLEVAHSLATRYVFSLEKGLLMWLRHVLDAERETRHLPRAIVAMDDLLADWRGSIEKIGREVGIEWPRFDESTAPFVDAFLTRDLKHQNMPDGNLPPAYMWAIKTYDAMLVLRDNPYSRLALGVLDDVGSTFEVACAFMGPAFAEIEAKVAGVDAEVAALRRERDELIRARNDRAERVRNQAQRNGALEPEFEDRLLNLRADSYYVRRRLEHLQVRLTKIAAEP
jgi:hypothetical protein